MLSTDLVGGYAFIQNPDKKEDSKKEIRVRIRLVSDRNLEAIVQTKKGKLIKVYILDFLRME